MPIHGYPGNVITANPTAPTSSVATGVWTMEQQLLARSAGNWPFTIPTQQIGSSLRFNPADTAYLNRTLGSSNRRTFTFSTWVKRSSLGAADNQTLFGCLNTVSGVNQQFAIQLLANETLMVFHFNSVDSTYFYYPTLAVFRDPSAWYHIVVGIDTTQATSTNRCKLYVNGVEQALNSPNNFTQNLDLFVNSGLSTGIGTQVGTGTGNLRYLGGYMAEVYFIDGQQLTPSSFGRTNTATGVWEPLAYTGTYGTNGFYLNFSDNSGTTSTTLGKDYSGNGNNWTPNNFSVTAGAGNDSLVDSPTSYGTDTGVGGEVRGNYCTLNPLQSPIAPTNGNLTVTGVGAHRNTLSTHYLPAVPVYIEAYPSTAQRFGFGIATASLTLTSIAVGQAAQKGMYSDSGGSGSIYDGITLLYASLPAISGTQVWQLALDTTTGKGWLGLNNVWYDSSGGTTGNPSTGANPTWTGITSAYSPMLGTYDGVASNINFGQRAFAYTAPSGFKALCTQNLPTPTIGATSTTQANDYMNVVLYSGNSSTQNITGVGFAPDFTWLKVRNDAQNHRLFDTVRGANKRLMSSSTAAEATTTDELTAFGSDGFTLGANTDVNGTGFTYVSWNWNAGGSTVTNTSGTISAQVRANTTSGFSIVTYTGNGTTGATFGHGLGVTPDMIIIKKRSTGTAGNWLVYHTSTGINQYLYLNSTAAAATSSPTWGVSSTLVTLQQSFNDYNTSTAPYVAYCFAPVAGYSAFGSYTGDGSTDGPFVFTNMRPRYLMIKNYTGAGNGWIIIDTARSTYNQTALEIYANSSAAEASSSAYVDILSNGFKLKSGNSDINNTGVGYIYMAFAENPFKYSLAR